MAISPAAVVHLCVPTDDSHAKKKDPPPLVVLHWGKVKSFAGEREWIFGSDVHGRPLCGGTQR